MSLRRDKRRGSIVKLKHLAMLAACLVGAVFVSGGAWAQKAATGKQAICQQIISCGIKNGKMKEYPDPCAARKDGATHIQVKTGPTCDSPM
jgi:hypothetical protein